MPARSEPTQIEHASSCPRMSPAPSLASTNGSMAVRAIRTDPLARGSLIPGWLAEPCAHQSVGARLLLNNFVLPSVDYSCAQRELSGSILTRPSIVGWKGYARRQPARSAVLLRRPGFRDPFKQRGLLLAVDWRQCLSDFLGAASASRPRWRLRQESGRACSLDLTGEKADKAATCCEGRRARARVVNHDAGFFWRRDSRRQPLGELVFRRKLVVSRVRDRCTVAASTRSPTSLEVRCAARASIRANRKRGAPWPSPGNDVTTVATTTTIPSVTTSHL